MSGHDRVVAVEDQPPVEPLAEPNLVEPLDPEIRDPLGERQPQISSEA